MQPKIGIDGEDTAPQRVREKAKESLLWLYEDIPEWNRDNSYILSGYRQPSNSYSKSAGSLLYLHNESVNIWTHLLGALAAAIIGALMYFSIKPRFEMASEEDVMVLSCFFFGAVTCLGMSATFHAISNHSESVSKFGNRLDHIGIIILIWGSFIPSIFYGFSSEPALIRRYWTMVSSCSLHWRERWLRRYRSLPSAPELSS